MIENSIAAPARMDLAVLDDYANRGLLRRQHHPVLPLTIWNYAATVPYSKAWDDVTLACRGMVTNEHGDIIMRPFPKFFNLEELDVLPDGPFSASVKMDGSLIIATWYKGEWLVASRGSFTSPQAEWGREIIESLHDDDVLPGVTYLFELIHPENRIVVDYGARRELVLLGMVSTESGRDVPRDLWPAGWACAPEVSAESLAPSDLKALNRSNEEGFVLRFEDGTRVKVKFEEYVRLHRIVTGVSTKTIWEHLRDGKPLEELLQHVPDEFNEWVRSKETQYQEDVEKILIRAGTAVDGARMSETRKDQALFIQAFLKECGQTPLSGVAFSLLDGNEDRARLGAYKLIEPKYEQPFSDRAES